jgi:hypothetical protein
MNLLVGDLDGEAADLTLSATSSNEKLVAAAGITFGGTEADRIVTIIGVSWVLASGAASRATPWIDAWGTPPEVDEVMAAFLGNPVRRLILVPEGF